MFAFFSDVFVNKGLKNFVSGSLNAEFCYLLCYSKKKNHFTILNVDY